MKKSIIIIPLILILSIVGANAYVTNNVNLPVYESWLQKIFSPFTGSWEVSQPPCDATKMGCLQDTETKECYCPIYGTNTQSAYSVMAAYPIDLYSCKVAITTNHYADEKSLIETQASQQGGTSCSWSQSTDMPEIWAYCCAVKGGATQNLDCSYPVQNPDGTLNRNVAISNGGSTCIGGTKFWCRDGKTFVDYLDDSCSPPPTDSCSAFYPPSTYPGACQVCTQDTTQDCSDGTKITTFNCHTFTDGVRKLIPTSTKTCSDQYCTKNTMCSDGVTILKLCVNGQLSDTGKTCPLPPSGFPKTISRGRISISVNSVAQETLIKDYLGISPAGVDQDTYLSRLSQAELVEWRDYYTTQFNKVGLSTSQILSQFNKYYVATPVTSQCSDYSSSSACVANTNCYWFAGFFGLGSECKQKTVTPCVATNQVCADGTTIAIQTCVNGVSTGTGKTCPLQPINECSSVSLSKCTTQSFCEGANGKWESNSCVAKSSDITSLKCCYKSSMTIQEASSIYEREKHSNTILSNTVCATLKAGAFAPAFIWLNCADVDVTKLNAEPITIKQVHGYFITCPAEYIERNESECVALGLPKAAESISIGTILYENVTKETVGLKSVVDDFSYWKILGDSERLQSVCSNSNQCQQLEGFSVYCDASPEIRKEVALTLARNTYFINDFRLFLKKEFAKTPEEVAKITPQGICLVKQEPSTANYCDYLVWAPDDFPTKNGSCTNGVYIILGVIALLVVVPPLLKGGK